MCVYSAVLDYGKRTWPKPGLPKPIPNLIQWEYFKKLLEMAQEFDKKANQPDCEDPKKVEWFKAMEKRMLALEEKINAKS